MINFTALLPILASLQWFAAITLVPLACWQFFGNHSVVCRWIALLSGYAVQIGFFLLLDDAGFEPDRLILIASIAAYFWVSTTLSLLPVKSKPVTNPDLASEPSSPLTE